MTCHRTHYAAVNIQPSPGTKGLKKASAAPRMKRCWLPLHKHFWLEFQTKHTFQIVKTDLHNFMLWSHSKIPCYTRMNQQMSSVKLSFDTW